jgi:hypothetical protein
MFFRLMVDSTDQVDIPCGVQQHFPFGAKKFARLLTFTITDINYVSVGRRQKTALLGLFSASFPHPVRGVSPTALNTLATPGGQVYKHLALAPHHPLFCRARCRFLVSWQDSVVLRFQHVSKCRIKVNCHFWTQMYFSRYHALRCYSGGKYIQR